MSIAEAVVEKLNALPPEKQEQVLEFVQSLSNTGPSAKPYAFFDTARKLNLRGPADWAANFEEYTDGDKKDAV